MGGSYIFADLPGWPLLTPLKVQMHKCEKCSLEFCSPVNYRRHTRLHRRALNFDKVLFVFPWLFYSDNVGNCLLGFRKFSFKKYNNK